MWGGFALVVVGEPPAGEHDDQVDTVAYAAKALPDLSWGGYIQKGRGRSITAGLLNRQF